MIIVISDFDLTGSGYMNIAVAMCNELASRGYNVKALGMGYNGAEHYWDFSIIPVPHQEAFGVVPVMFHNLQQLAGAGEVEEIEAIVVALDIPMQERLMTMKRDDIPYVAIFPVESGPLCMTWATIVSSFEERLVISKFGLRQMEKAGVSGIHFPVGLDTESWRPPAVDERETFRESMGYTDDDFVILTVADNQERKNLSAGAEIIRELVNEGYNVKWNLVTRKGSPVGWKLDDLFLEYGISDRVSIYERGIPHDRLWVLHITSDVFLLTSKAEGLCMPVLEAMATKTPVVATECTAIPEHLWEDPNWSREENGIWKPEKRTVPKIFGGGRISGFELGQRGFPIDVEFYTRDPWGNSYRAYVDPKSAVRQVKKIIKMPKEKLDEITERAREYAESRTWDKAGDVIDGVLKRLISLRELNQKPPDEPLSETINPPTIPAPIPIQVNPEGAWEDE
ncbi:MAG: glycosyltransferase family 4 protein [Candidatus Thorarchaeota archaeon]|jgi:glycosyltransferase involved in cell wall biosynthesis